MNTTGKAVAQVAFTIAKVTIGMWVALIVADLLTFYMVYSSTATFLEGRGLSEYMAKFWGVIWSSALIVVMNRVLWAVVKRNHKVWVPWVGGLWATALLALYFLTASYIGSPFDPFSGKAQNYYVDQRGQIHMIGRSAVTGPNGEDVKAFDKAAAQKYEQQQKKRGLRPVSQKGVLDKPWNPFESNTKEPELQMEVESVELYPDRTVVMMSVQRMDPYRPGRFFRAPLNNELVDGYGEAYKFQQDTAEYADLVDAKTHEPVELAQTNGSGSWHLPSYAKTKYVKPNEVYRFESVYAPVPHDVESLEIRDPRFDPVDITYALGPAKRRVAQRKVQAAKDVAAAQVQLALDLKAAQQAERQRVEQEQAERDAALVRSVMNSGMVDSHAAKLAEIQTRVDTAKTALVKARNEFNRAAQVAQTNVGSRYRMGSDSKLQYTRHPLSIQYDAMEGVKKAEKYLSEVSAELAQAKEQKGDGSYVILRSDAVISKRLPQDELNKWNALKVRQQSAEAALENAKGIYKRAYDMWVSFPSDSRLVSSPYGKNTAQDLQRGKEEAQITLTRAEAELAQIKAEMTVLWEQTRRWWEPDGLN